MSESIIDFLKKVELFKGLEADELSDLVSNLEEKEYAVEDMLFVEDGPREEMLFIRDGKVLLFKKTPFGEEKTISYFGQFDFLGEGAVIDDTPHFTSARAIEKTSVYSIQKDKLNTIFKQNGSVAVRVLSYIAKVISRTCIYFPEILVISRNCLP